MIEEFGWSSCNIPQAPAGAHRCCPVHSQVHALCLRSARCCQGTACCLLIFAAPRPNCTAAVMPAVPLGNISALKAGLDSAVEAGLRKLKPYVDKFDAIVPKELGLGEWKPRHGMCLYRSTKTVSGSSSFSTLAQAQIECLKTSSCAGVYQCVKSDSHKDCSSCTSGCFLLRALDTNKCLHGCPDGWYGDGAVCSAPAAMSPPNFGGVNFADEQPDNFPLPDSTLKGRVNFFEMPSSNANQRAQWASKYNVKWSACPDTSTVEKNRNSGQTEQNAVELARCNDADSVAGTGRGTTFFRPNGERPTFAPCSRRTNVPHSPRHV